MSIPGAGCGMVRKTGILLVIETTWEFRNAAWLVCFPGSCIICAAIELPNRPSEEWSPESKRKLKNRQPLVRFKPSFGRAVMVPLPLCPWYLQSVMMYAKGWSCNHARAGVGAALLRVLGTCQVVLVDVAPGTFGRVRSFNGRTRKLP